jgi:hypothetical protein
MNKISLSRLRVFRLLCGRSAVPPASGSSGSPRPALDPQALRARPAPRTSDLRLR